MQAVEGEDRITVRTAMAKECGFTGLSVLHRLNQLYGFDVLRDMVYDSMHNVPMNVVGQHLHHYVQNGFYSNTNKALVEQRLSAMPWSSGTSIYTFIFLCVTYTVLLLLFLLFRVEEWTNPSWFNPPTGVLES